MQSNLAECVKIMYKKLKKNINIPRYEYGSAGTQHTYTYISLAFYGFICISVIVDFLLLASLAIMTFYSENLANLANLADLRTAIFHQFTQIGNAIIFSLLLEQTLVKP